MDAEQAAERAEELRRQIRRHDFLYYVKDAPEVSDAAYDELFTELKELEEQFPQLVTDDSPTQRVGGAPLDALPTVEHEAPMLSLDSSQELEKLQRFDERVRKALGAAGGDGAALRYVAEPKLDGASVELVYRDGSLARAATRGNGTHGEEITENIRTIPSVPLKLRDTERPVPAMVSLRGEVIMHHGAFEELNEKLLAEGKTPFANPRNAAAGGLRQLDPRLTAQRRLDIFVYDLLAGEGVEPASQWQVRQALSDWGLKVNPRVVHTDSLEEIQQFHRRLMEERDDLGYEIDGVVIKLDDFAGREQMGTTSHHPRWAFAYKFPPRKEVTRVLKIVPSVGRTGVVTPVALMNPVEIGGVTVSRATLHNREEVARKDIREGDKVRVQRAGDVIPQVVERIEEEGRQRGPAFAMPEVCPSCGTELVERGPFSVCPNAFDCPAQLAGRLIHFGSRGALDIEGLGEETAKLLVDEGLVEHLPDLFDLEPEQLVGFEGFGDKSATKLVEGIRKAAKVELARFLFGLGIPEVGATVARDLARHFGTLANLRQAGAEALMEVDGVGPRMSDAITAFFAEERNAQLLDRLLTKVELQESEPAGGEEAGERPLTGLKFVFTGGLEHFTRDDAKRKVEALGAATAGSVSGRTDYVVAGEDAGSKLDKARKLGVEVLDEAGFLELLRSAGEEV